ncbi:hypothetical protein OG21DRAFT_1512971 [Imleria badia]|nr:hypothetical protein OG21DRAFT_1512971 [Imleria badia]
MLIVGQEHDDPPIEFNHGDELYAFTFSANGEHLLSGGRHGVRVWQVEDGKQVATISMQASYAEHAESLAVSQDGRWIAVGTSRGEVWMLDAKTYEKVFSYDMNSFGVGVCSVHFAPDSTRLVATTASEASSWHGHVVWDIATGKQAPTPPTSNSFAFAVKYSPLGDRIATVSFSSVELYDSNDGRLLLDIRSYWGSTRLLWRGNDHLLVAWQGKIQQINASTGEVSAEWPMPDGNTHSSIVTPKHGEFIAFSVKNTVMFWDTSTHTQLGCIQHPRDIHSMELSPDGRLLAIRDKDGKITIKNLTHVTYDVPVARLYPTFQEPDIRIDHAALDSWKHDQLADTEALLTAAIATPQNPRHHALASRAIIRARLQQWDAAVDDAEKSIKIQPSTIAHIAKSVALVGKGEKYKAYRACDIAFDHFLPSRVRFVLLIKAVIVFMAGDHDDAISRVDDLIAMVCDNPTCYVIQAYMYFLIGKLRMESRHYEGAIRSLERAQTLMRPHTGQGLLMVSLITGWKFDDLGVRIQRHLCEALYAASRAMQACKPANGCILAYQCEALYAGSRAKQAGESLLKMTDLFNTEVYFSNELTQWVSDFTQRCLAMPESFDFIHWSRVTPQSDDDAISEPSPLLKEWAKATLIDGSWIDALTTSVSVRIVLCTDILPGLDTVGYEFMAPRFTIYRAICHCLEMMDRILDASKCFLQMVNEFKTGSTTHREQAEWLDAFRQRCAERLEHLGDVAADAQQHDDAIIQYSAALSLHLPSPHVFIKRSKAYMAVGQWEDALDDANQVITLDPSSAFCHERVLMEWAKVNLKNALWKNALSAARDFKGSRLLTYRIFCEGLEKIGGMLDAIQCFHHMASEMTQEAIAEGEQAEWFREFKHRCCDNLERLGDGAMNSQPERHDEALKYYSAALSVYPANTQRFFILRSKVGMAKGLWEDAVVDANEAIALDPSSPWGYKAKRAALHRSGRYEDAIQTFETMLSKMAHSPDPQIRGHRGQYVSPSRTQAMIRKIVQRTVRHSPRVLINTTTGRLLDKTEQAATFMSLPIVNELVSSMTTRIDRGRIKREVRQFFRYVMLSHKWEENEPLFQQVIHMAVYDLDQSPTHDKLQMFCKFVRDAGFNWAWSDTCCIDKQDHFVLQEALVAMFKWYRGSVMTIVYLRGVRSPSTFGDLVQSIWNTRAWTLQEYVAAKVIRFYTEDWTPYLNLDIFNHKESSEIISEMEQATGVSAQQLKALRPGLSSIREKLRLASTRHTTMVEDAAYSLLGIFSIAGLPAIYGEGEGALGRLLAHILAGSGDASILAWTGQSSTYNSCLPAEITAFNRPATSHLPVAIEDAEMENVVTTLRTSTLDLDLALMLYDRLHEIPTPWFAASRMKLPCIAFKLPALLPYRTYSGHLYRVDTPVFGTVEIKIKLDPSRLNALYLVHPWLDALLGREDMDMQSGVFVGNEDVEPSSPDRDEEDVSDDDIEEDASPLPESPSQSAPMDTTPVDRETRALQLVARLRQPFGALLFTLASTRRRAVEYRRVAADSMITVQIQEDVPLTDVLDNVRILDVL